MPPILCPTSAKGKFANLVSQHLLKEPSVDGFFKAMMESRAAAMLFSPVTLTKNAVFTLANQAFRTGEAFVAPGVEALARGAQALTGRGVAPRQRFVSEGVARVYGLFHSLPAMLSEYGTLTRANRENLTEVGQGFAGTLGKVVRAPLTALSLTDGFLFNHEFSANMYQRAMREAAKHGGSLDDQLMFAAGYLQDASTRAGAVTRKARDEALASAQAKGFIDPKEVEETARAIAQRAAPDDIFDARTLAERTLFIAREGKKWDQAMDFLGRVDKEHGGIVSVIMPFRRTPANEAREYLRASPIGYWTAFQKYQAALKNKIDPQRALGMAYDDVARATVGTAVFTGLAYGAHYGLYKVNRFDKGKTKAQRDTEEALGVKQDTIQIGNQSIPAANLGALGRAILNVDEAVQSHREYLATGDRTWVDKAQMAAGGVALDFPMRVADDVFLDDVTRFLQSFHDEFQQKRFGERFGATLVPSFIPQVRRVVGGPQATTEVPLEPGFAEGAISGVKAKLGVGGVPKLGLFGEEKKQPGGLLGGTLGIQQPKDDPLVQRMLQIGLTKEAPDTALTDFKKKPIEFTAEESVAFGKAKGALQRAFMERQLNTPGFKNLPPEAQKRLLNTAFGRASKIVDTRMRSLNARGIRPDYRLLLKGLVTE